MPGRSDERRRDAAPWRIETAALRRVAEFQAEMALELLPSARANGDHDVIGACVRVRGGWLSGRTVTAHDLALVEEFQNSMREASANADALPSTVRR